MVRRVAAVIIWAVVTRRKSPESNAWRDGLTAFFAGPLAQQAGAFLTERAVIAIHVKEECFLFRRQNGANTLTEGEGPADVQFSVPPESLRHLLDLANLPGAGLGTMGVAVIEHLFHRDPAKKIHFNINRDFLSLWANGYFSVLKAGGPEVASYLARWGFDSFSRIREMLRKLKG